MEGDLQIDYKDSLGRYMFCDFAETAKHQGSGFVGYHWPRPGHLEPIEKLSGYTLEEVKGKRPGDLINSGEQTTEYGKPCFT